MIRGTVPSPLAWPPGCRFEPRCDYAFGKCIDEHPPLFDLPALGGDAPASAPEAAAEPAAPSARRSVDGQQSACWHCERGRRVPGSPMTVVEAES